jgi:integrase/recombinase XerC
MSLTMRAVRSVGRCHAASCSGCSTCGDEGVEAAAGAPRKGWLAAFRDATMFKSMYGWGLRRTETAMLDMTDVSTNPAAPQLGGLGVCHVRFGKAQRGSPPRRRAVATVMPWTAEALEQ